MKKIILTVSLFLIIKNIFAYKYVLIGPRADGNGCQYEVIDEVSGQTVGTCQDACSRTSINPILGNIQIVSINPKSNLGKWIIKNDPRQNLKKVVFINKADANLLKAKNK